MNVLRATSGALAASALWLAPSVAASPAINAWPAVTPGAGLAVYNSAGDDGSVCTAGWLAHKDSKLVLLLPSHCNYGGDVKLDFVGDGFSTIGVFAQPLSRKTNGIDVGYVELRGGVPVDSRIADRDRISSAPFKLNKGDQLCKYGARTGLRCGAVLSNPTSSTVEFSAAAAGGDSGSPVFLRQKDGTATPVGITVEGDEHSTIAVLLQPVLDRLGATLA